MKPMELLRGLCLGAMLTALFFCVGCVGSRNPVLKDEQVIYDKDLLGEWIFNVTNVISHRTIVTPDGSSKVTFQDNGSGLHVTVEGKDAHSNGTIDFKGGSISGITIQEGQGNQYIITNVNQDQPQKGTHIGRLGKIGDQWVFEIKQDPKGNVDSTVDSPVDPGTPDSQLPVYLFGLVEKVSATQFKVRLLMPVWLAEYLKQHPDELAIQKAVNNEKNLLITSSTEQLQTFITNHLNDADAWSGPILFVHPGDPATQPSAVETPPAGASTQPSDNELHFLGATTQPSAYELQLFGASTQPAISRLKLEPIPKNPSSDKGPAKSLRSGPTTEAIQ